MRVRDMLLMLLARGPSHGYQLKLDYERLTSSGPVNVGQIYQTLERLERDGLVARTGRDRGDRRISYRLTAAGDEMARELVFEASDAPRTGRSEIATKLLVALETPGLDALEVLDAQRVALVEAVMAMRRASRAGVATVSERLGIEADMSVIEAELRWLDMCDDELKGIS
jgi:DNA-binding PadR family transcriptional regulator